MLKSLTSQIHASCTFRCTRYYPKRRAILTVITCHMHNIAPQSFVVTKEAKTMTEAEATITRYTS